MAHQNYIPYPLSDNSPRFPLRLITQSWHLWDIQETPAPTGLLRQVLIVLISQELFWIASLLVAKFAFGHLCVAKLFWGTVTHIHTRAFTLPVSSKLLNNPCCHFTTLGIPFGQFAFGLDPLWMLTFTLSKWTQCSPRWAYNFNAHCRK